MMRSQPGRAARSRRAPVGRNSVGRNSVGRNSVGRNSVGRREEKRGVTVRPRPAPRISDRTVHTCARSAPTLAVVDRLGAALAVRICGACTTALATLLRPSAAGDEHHRGPEHEDESQTLPHTTISFREGGAGLPPGGAIVSRSTQSLKGGCSARRSSPDRDHESDRGSMILRWKAPLGTVHEIRSARRRWKWWTPASWSGE